MESHNGDDSQHAAPAETTSDCPKWLAGLVGIALVLMASQVKLPFTGGRVAFADLALAAAFAGIVWMMWRSRESLRFPALLGIALFAYGFASLFARAGMAGAIESVQRVEQFFCGYLLFAFLMKYRPRWLPRLILIGLCVNALAAIAHGLAYGYGSFLPPQDVRDLPLGFGKAYSGLFRSRVALSFYLAGILAWLQPQWARWATTRARAAGVVAATVLGLSLIAHGQILAIASVIIILGALLQGRRAVAISLLAVVLAALVLPLTSSNRSDVLLSTLSPVRTDDGKEGVLKTRHIDLVAAMRMARARPLTGVGAGRYQSFVGRCYRELPNPNVNDIEADTQSGLGILLGTVGFPAGILLLLVFAGGAAGAVARALKSETPDPILLGSASAMGVFLVGMLVSDPLTSGLSWFVCLALATAHGKTPQTAPDAAPDLTLDFRKTLLLGIGYAVVAAMTVVIPTQRDPLAKSPRTTPKRTTPPTATQAAQASTQDHTTAPPTPALPAAIDFFKVIDAGDAKTVTTPIVKTSDSQAANETILHIPDKSGTPPEGEEPEMKYGGAVFDLEAPADVTCKVWLRVWWEGSCGNTVFFKAPKDGSPITVGNDGTFDAWHWLEVPKVYSFKKGSHELFILNREDGIRIDQILVTNDMEYFPQGIEEE